MMQSFDQMCAFVMHLLKTKLPAEYYYHNYAHTEHIVKMVAEIGKAEHCSEKEIDLLKIAALWHDTGYVNIYQGHEQESCELAKTYLPGYSVNSDDIDQILGIIMATKVPQTPHNLLEQIIADADLEYLGTGKASEVAEQLYKELKHLNQSLTRESWHQTQISFISNHHYFTDFCKQHREPVKQTYLSRLIEKPV